MRLNKYLLVIVVLMITAVMFRVFNHHYNVLLNFSPIAAIALFGATNLKNRLMAFGIPMLVLFASDCFIGFHNTMFFTYGSFALIGLLGFVTLRNKFSVGRLILIALSSSLIFFVITNFGVWLMPNTMYSKDIEGLITCYERAVPYFGNTVAGDLFFSALLFGVFEYIKQTNWLVKAKA